MGGVQIQEIPAQGLFEAYRSAGKELYLVGGYVRDTLLGKLSHDLDFATSATPDESIRILEAAGLKAIPTGIEFGTVATHVEHLGEVVQAQITTYRCRESYTKGSRHPTVVFGSGIEEDLIRRDFTVNAMAMDDTGAVIDPFGGGEDLGKGIIRTPLDPVVTFSEDPLRMLRAVRFRCRLEFTLDEKVREALSSCRGSIRDISHERWKQEMDGILTVGDGRAVADALDILRDTGLLVEMMPEFGPMLELGDAPQGSAHLKGVWGHTLDVISELPPGLELRWAGLLHDLGKPVSRTLDENGSPHFYGHEEAGAVLAREIAERFRFSRRERKNVVFLVRNHMRPVLYTGEWGDSAVRRLAADSSERLPDLLDLAEADIRAHTEDYVERGLQNLGELRERLSAMIPSVGERLLPRELGQIIERRLGESGQGGRRTGLLLGRLEELVRNGELPAQAAPEFYLEFLIDRRLLDEE